MPNCGGGFVDDGDTQCVEGSDAFTRSVRELNFIQELLRAEKEPANFLLGDQVLPSRFLRPERYS